MAKRVLQGVVVSDKMDKTVVIRVDRKVSHPLYGKIETRSKRYKAHDEGNLHRVGEKIQIQECRPLSKDKCWVVVEKEGPA